MHRSPRRAFVTGLVAAAALAPCLPAVAAGGGDAARGRTKLVSATPAGAPGNGASTNLRTSADGRHIAFLSDAGDLVPGDTNGVADVFVRDLRTGRTERVSVASDGAQSDAGSGSLGVSRDGRVVAFVSSAGNLAPGGAGGIFVHDRRTGETRRVSPPDRPSDGGPASFSYAPQLSADGRYVAFTSNAAALSPGEPAPGPDNRYQAYVHDLRTGRTERASTAADGSRADRDARPTALSADGRLVSLTTRATNLVPGDTNDEEDVFVRDRRTGRTERISVADDGAEVPSHRGDLGGGALSADGRYAVFESGGDALVAGDTNDTTDVFVRDRRRGTTERVNLSAAGGQLAYRSIWSDISGSGRYVSFATYDPGVVPGDTNGRFDVFLRDVARGSTQRISLGEGGAQPDGDSIVSSLDHRGRTVAFGSLAGNLARGDTNDAPDVFARLR
ncbi:hypothetical protein [Streptomyces sp. ODS28]|uniref:hypothetical protein n=1 Tax=Streptomyces sp. ODS28 TaxID=3136688 RepID=UPI0031E9516D